MNSLFRLFLAALATASSAAHAATFEPLDIDQLSTRADQIFVGTVSGSTSGRTFRGAVVTDFTFVDVEPIKGASPATIDVRMFGGTAGDETVQVAGAPAFRVGERYVVFIAGNGRAMFPTLGGPAGIYPVRSDPVTHQQKVYEYGGRPLIALPSGVEPSARPKELAPREYAPAAEGMDLATFVAEIRKRIAR